MATHNPHVMTNHMALQTPRDWTGQGIMGDYLDSTISLADLMMTTMTLFKVMLSQFFYEC